jgi:putative ABC transport system permease protein
MKLLLNNFLVLLKRFTASSVLNIVGLAIAFAVFFVIVVQTYYDFGFNRNFKNANNIYVYTLHRPSDDGRNTQVSAQLLKELANKHPEIVNHCYLQEMWNNYDIRDSDGTTTGTIRNVPITYSKEGEGESFVKVFKPEVIAGDPLTAFTPEKTMMTESMAKKFFGNENPIGKTFFLQNTNISIVVAAVCKDFPENCSLRNGIYVLRDRDFGTYGTTAYLEALPNSKEKILERETTEFQRKGDTDEWQTELTALPDIHLKFSAKGKGNLTLTIMLLTIGVLLMVIAYINFVNFAVAMAPVRLKGFNIRRILGESSFFLKFSIIMEAVLFSFIAFSLSILFIHLFNGGVISAFFSADISLSNNNGLLLAVAGASVVMGFLAGIYPAFYSTSFKPVMVLSGSFATSRGSKSLRNTLITVQFVTVFFLVITAGFITMQKNYLQNKSWGINKKNVVYMPLRQIKQNLKDFEDELKKNANIIDITYSSYIPGIPGMINWERTYNGENVNVAVWPVSSNFFQFFGSGVIEGHDFQPEDDESEHEKMIFNRAFVERYGLSNITGTAFPGTNPSETAEIIGISEDINFESLKEPIKPMAFISRKNYWSNMDHLFIRINGQNTTQTFDYIRKTWTKFTANGDLVIEPQFLDDMHNKVFDMYKKENDLAKLISICGMVTIIIAVMGVYGLILFNVKLKRKTIAIHKISGASTKEIILMLNRGFLVQFTVAYIIAVPLAYIVVQRWLDNFAYKVPIHWWIFVAGGLLVFLVTALTISHQSYKAATANPVEGIKTE